MPFLHEFDGDLTVQLRVLGHINPAECAFRMELGFGESNACNQFLINGGLRKIIHGVVLQIICLSSQDLVDFLKGLNLLFQERQQFRRLGAKGFGCDVVPFFLSFVPKVQQIVQLLLLLDVHGVDAGGSVKRVCS